MTPKGKVIHRQQFQNAQQIIEVTVKNKPRVKIVKSSNNNKPKPFVRDCVLKSELEKLVKEEEEKKLKIKARKMNQERPMPKLKINHPKTAHEIQKKFKKKMKEKKNHDFLAPGMSWAECLQNISSSRASAASDNSEIHAANAVTEINKEELKRRQKRAAEKIALLDMKCVNQNKKYRPITPELQSDRLEIMNHIDNPLHSSLENLTNKLTKLCRPVQVNKAIQTSRISIPEVPPLDLPDSQKSIPILKLNKSHNQTHSPFGESAIRLLHHLRERLRSKGDSEGSEIVNALEAYFGSAENKANGNIIDVEESASPVFPISIPKSDSVTPTFEKDKFERIIAEQGTKLKEQEENILKLKSFSKRVIDYHGDLLNLVSGSSSNNQIFRNDAKQMKSNDSGIDLNHSGELKIRLRALLEEKEQLEKIVKEHNYEKDRLKKIIDDQKNSIMQLELEFHQFKKEHQCNDDNRRPTPANGCVLYRYERPTSREKCASSLRNTDAALLLHTSNVSDENIDSAFEERSSKSISRPSSNSTCNKHRLNEANPYEKSKEKLNVPLQDLKWEFKEMSLSTLDPDSLSTTTDTLTQGRCVANGAAAPVLSETLVRNTPDWYLESTHVNNKKTFREFNEREFGSVQRAGFATMEVSAINESETSMPIKEMNESETLMPVTEL